MPRFRFNASVNPRIKDLTEVMKLDAKDMQRMLKTVDAAFRINMRQQFSTEGRSGGEAWPPLSPKYKAWKQKRFGRKKIMQRTGRLRRSLAFQGADHVRRAFTVPRARLVMGTRVNYAAFHIPGVLKNRNLPDRDPLQHTDRQERVYRRMVSDYLINFKLKRVERAMNAARRRRGRRG